MYITFEEYSEIYDPMEERTFTTLEFDAGRVMDLHTTGIDNVKKLQKFLPTDEYNLQAVNSQPANCIHP